MADINTNQEDIPNKVSRRYLLKNSAIAATGAVLLPSLITGCSKDTNTPQGGGGLGGTQLTPDQLKQTAANIAMYRQLIIEVYQLAFEYDSQVFTLLESTKTNSWTNFSIDIIIDIAFLLAAAGAIASGGAEAVPAIAFFSAVLHDWGFGKATNPPSLTDTFVEFELGRIAMQSAIEDTLSDLADPGQDGTYSNLRAKGENPISFNGSSYTLEDLASRQFTLGDEYNKIKDTTFKEMKKAVWNLLIMKCCSYYKADDGWVTLKGDS